jgi:hypothetical protein
VGSQYLRLGSITAVVRVDIDGDKAALVICVLTV